MTMFVCQHTYTTPACGWCVVQLYNEEVNDLLSPQNIKLPIHESKDKGLYVCGLREDIVTGPEAVLSLLDEGEANRHVGSTKMNEKSSRSHTVFRMVRWLGTWLRLMTSWVKQTLDRSCHDCWLAMIRDSAVPPVKASTAFKSS